jgi:hypothetical protein
LYVVLTKKKIRHINITQQTDEEILVTTFDCRLKGEIGTVLHLNRTGPHSH